MSIANQFGGHSMCPRPSFGCNVWSRLARQRLEERAHCGVAHHARQAELAPVNRAFCVSDNDARAPSLHLARVTHPLIGLARMRLAGAVDRAGGRASVVMRRSRRTGTTCCRAPGSGPSGRFRIHRSGRSGQQILRRRAGHRATPASALGSSQVVGPRLPDLDAPRSTAHPTRCVGPARRLDRARCKYGRTWPESD